MYPAELQYLQQKELERQNIEKCKAWKVERDWCIENGIDVSELPEEIEYQELIQAYRLRQKKKSLEEQIQISKTVQKDKFSKRHRIREPKVAMKIQNAIKSNKLLVSGANLNIVEEVANEASEAS